jgi:FixJ family two-component response regulator
MRHLRLFWFGAGKHMVQDHAGAVAIVDNDPAVLDSLKFLLEVAGHTVATYTSAAAFLADRVTKHACLILDHHMPQMTGLELVGRLRAAGTAIPVLLITGSPSPAIVGRAGELGVEQVLEKPPIEDDPLNFVAAHR